MANETTTQAVPRFTLSSITPEQAKEMHSQGKFRESYNTFTNASKFPKDTIVVGTLITFLMKVNDDRPKDKPALVALIKEEKTGLEIRATIGAPTKVIDLKEGAMFQFKSMRFQPEGTKPDGEPKDEIPYFDFIQVVYNMTDIQAPDSKAAEVKEEEAEAGN